MLESSLWTFCLGVLFLPRRSSKVLVTISLQAGRKRRLLKLNSLYSRFQLCHSRRAKEEKIRNLHTRYWLEASQGTFRQKISRCLRDRQLKYRARLRFVRWSPDSSASHVSASRLFEKSNEPIKWYWWTSRFEENKLPFSKVGFVIQYEAKMLLVLQLNLART